MKQSTIRLTRRVTTAFTRKEWRLRERLESTSPELRRGSGFDCLGGLFGIRRGVGSVLTDELAHAVEPDTSPNTMITVPAMV